MSRFLYRTGRWAAAHGKLVLAGWIAVLVLLGVLSQTVGGHVTDQFELPGAESQAAADLLAERFPAVGQSSATVVVAAAINVPTTAEILALMLGIAAGIDYALFVMSRHRENLVAGMDVPESIGRSLATAGGAVVFAGSTVVIAMLGSIVVGAPSITTMAFVVAFAIIVAVLVAITLLPALLGMAGQRLAAPTLPGLRNRRAGAGSTNLGTRWTTWVARWPWLSFGMAVAAMGRA